MAGARPKPSAKKKLEGSYREDRDNPKKPKAEPGLPKPPEWLNKAGKDAYRGLANDLERMGVTSKEDTHLLSIVCQAYGELIEFKKDLNKNGHTYEAMTDKGSTIYRKRPEAELASDKEKFVASKLSEFGLSPSSREKVSRIADSEGESGLTKILNDKE